MNQNENSADFNRREFLKSGSLAALMAVMGGAEVNGQTATNTAAGANSGFTAIPIGRTVKVGVIGLGDWGREILKNLALLKQVSVAGVCDTYEAGRHRVGRDLPKAEQFDDYTKLLASDVEAVIVATPTHTHKQIVLDALGAGKNVYCEAPLASTIEDARTIAAAAKKATKVVFQSGLQERSHPQRQFLVPFIREGAWGKTIMGRSQWHRKTSWRRTAPTPEREQALNWRLDAKQSLGLAGEIGIHQLDVASWFFKSRPTAVTGFGSLLQWNDGRTVPDTIQAIVEFPHGTRLMYDASLCTSFDNAYEVYHGSEATIMVRDEKAWLFKEVDAQLLGWEVYARKDQFYTETGIALVANATKQSSIGQSATAAAFDFQPIYKSVEAFIANVAMVGDEVKSYIDSYGDDLSALPETLSHLKTYPAAGWREGLDATIVAIKANEAVVGNQKVAIDPQLFDL